MKNIYNHVYHVLYMGYYAYNHESREKGIEKLDGILDVSASLNEHELTFVCRTREVWVKSIDANFVPAGHSTINSDVDVLFLKGQYALNHGDHQEHVRCSWMALQNCSSGTLRFLRILSNMIDAVAAIDDMEMARHATEMFLSHYDLMVCTSKYAFISLGNNSPSDTNGWLNKADGLKTVLPWEVALKYIEGDTSPCWERILRMHLETSSEESRQAYSYQESIAALQAHYKRTGDVSNLEFLKTYE